MGRPHMIPDPPRPKVGDLVQHPRFKVVGEVTNWLGLHLLEIRIVEAPGVMVGAWPIGTLHDVAWDAWRIIGTGQHHARPAASYDPDGETDDFED